MSAKAVTNSRLTVGSAQTPAMGGGVNLESTADIMVFNAPFAAAA